MAKFFGLFGKAKNVDEITEDDRNPIEKAKAFFLESEDARSLGKNKSTPKTEANTQKIESKPNPQTSPVTPKRTSTDSSMDTFRKMARDLKK
jgi:hypothetical protein